MDVSIAFKFNSYCSVLLILRGIINVVELKFRNLMRFNNFFKKYKWIAHNRNSTQSRIDFLLFDNYTLAEGIYILTRRLQLTLEDIFEP